MSPVRTFTPEQTAEIIRLYVDEKTNPRAIATQLKTGDNKIRQCLIDQGIPIRHEHTDPCDRPLNKTFSWLSWKLTRAERLANQHKGLGSKKES